MNDRYHMFGNRQDNEEFHLFSNDREDLLTRAQKFLKKGYFVFLVDQKTGSMKEIKS